MSAPKDLLGVSEKGKRTKAVYALCCPVSRQVRYVGVGLNPAVRYKHHVGKRSAWNVRRWVLALRLRGKQPRLIVLAFVREEESKDAEKTWIRRFAGVVHPLLNDQHGVKSYVSSWTIARSLGAKSTYNDSDE